jgi:hypothetical protein
VLHGSRTFLSCSAVSYHMQHCTMPVTSANLLLLTTRHTQRIVLDVLPHLLDVITPPAGVRALPFITLPAPEQLAIHGKVPLPV